MRGLYARFNERYRDLCQLRRGPLVEPELLFSSYAPVALHSSSLCSAHEGNSSSPLLGKGCYLEAASFIIFCIIG